MYNKQLKPLYYVDFPGDADIDCSDFAAVIAARDPSEARYIASQLLRDGLQEVTDPERDITIRGLWELSTGELISCVRSAVVEHRSRTLWVEPGRQNSGVL